MELSVMWPGWKGSLERMDTCICMAESLCCSPELSQHCLLIGYTPIQNKKFKKYINGLNQRLANSATVI